MWRGLRADLDYDPRQALAAIQSPLLLILGEEDRLSPAHETAQRVKSAFDAGRIQDLTVHLIPGADHALLVKPNPQAPWLAEVPAENWVAEMIEWTLRTENRQPTATQPAADSGCLCIESPMAQTPCATSGDEATIHINQHFVRTIPGGSGGQSSGERVFQSRHEREVR